MLRVACKDIGIADCEFAAEGEKVRKVESTMIDHLREEHPAMVAGLTDLQHKELKTHIKSGMHGLKANTQPHELDKHVMLRISCATFGTPGCEFVAEGAQGAQARRRSSSTICATNTRRSSPAWPTRSTARSSTA